ncbi:hypothetical protein J588_3770 [Acinetobacter sp. 1578804]|nr:hypothetical protein J588_3770 [Acinetobacter sp. 1578804]
MYSFLQDSWYAINARKTSSSRIDTFSTNDEIEQKAQD